VTFTYDLKIQTSSRGCQGTCSSKISSTQVQRFVSYHGNGEKKLSNDAKNNTAITSAASKYSITIHKAQTCFRYKFSLNKWQNRN